VAPDIEAGNILAKQLSYFCRCDCTGIVMGARCPIALTSRADPVESRLASAALLGLVSLYRSETAPVIS
jgi:phosphate acetyltransferase